MKGIQTRRFYSYRSTSEK